MLIKIFVSLLIIWNRQLLINLFLEKLFTAFIFRVFIWLSNTLKHYIWFSILFTFFDCRMLYGKYISSFFNKWYINLHNILCLINSRKALYSWQNICFCYCTATNITTLFITHTDKSEVDSSSRAMELSPFLCQAMWTRLLNTKKNVKPLVGKKAELNCA